MRKVLTTFGTGDHAKLLEVSAPLMARYAARHGYGFYLPTENQLVGGIAQEEWALSGEYARNVYRENHSWLKIPLICRLFREGADTVVWIDADVIIADGTEDIVDSVRLWSPLSMVVQRTADGGVPSCGVMVACQPAVRTLVEAWRAKPRSDRVQCWWEQANIIDVLGGDTSRTPIVTPPKSDRWGELPYHWNPHPNDPRGIPEDCRFFHATAVPDRLGEMKKWASKANW